MLSVDVNYVAILASAVVSFIIGFVWYGPIFGKQWATLMGKKDMGSKDKMIKNSVVMLIALIVMEYVFANIIKFSQSTTLMDGMLSGFIVWLGLIATTMIGSILWEGKPVKLYLINSLHYLAVLLVSGAILAIWI